MNIGYYLDKIMAGKPVNAKAFKNTLTACGLSIDEIHSGIEFRSSPSGKLNFVHFSNKQLEARLVGISSAKGTLSRALAATQNCSHDTNVEGSFLLVRNGIKHPNVVVFDADGSYTTPPCERFALVIENRQNFLSIEATSAFIERECDLEISTGFDVVFGAGNEISNVLHSKYLSEYEKIYMLFDFDAGGLQIAASLAAITPGTDHVFLIPSSLGSRLDKVAVHTKQDILSRVYLLGTANNFLEAAAQIIVKHKKTIEQESFLS